MAIGARNSGQCNVQGWKLFKNLDNLEQERKAAKEVYLAKLKQRENEIMRRITLGLCQHCGGELKGLFSKKCGSCGKPKDY